MKTRLLFFANTRPQFLAKCQQRDIAAAHSFLSVFSLYFSLSFSISPFSQRSLSTSLSSFCIFPFFSKIYVSPSLFPSFSPHDVGTFSFSPFASSFFASPTVFRYLTRNSCVLLKNIDQLHCFTIVTLALSSWFTAWRGVTEPRALNFPANHISTIKYIKIECQSNFIYIFLISENQIIEKFFDSLSNYFEIFLILFYLYFLHKLWIKSTKLLN